VNEFTPRPGRLALFLEGGYHQMALKLSVTDTLGGLLDLPTHPAAPTYGGPGMNEVRLAVSERRRAMEAIQTAMSSVEGGG
jgi:acetoin utilization deacetylase AcuC-like enzyme